MTHSSALPQPYPGPGSGTYLLWQDHLDGLYTVKAVIHVHIPAPRRSVHLIMQDHHERVVRGASLPCLAAQHCAPPAPATCAQVARWRARAAGWVDRMPPAPLRKVLNPPRRSTLVLDGVPRVPRLVPQSVPWSRRSSGLPV